MFRRRSPALAAFLAITAVLAGATTASAAIYTVGSDLRRSATVAVAHGADTAFWATAIGNRRPVTLARTGQVVEVRLKGTAIPSPQSRAGGAPPLTEVHFQSLRPLGNGSVVVINSSQPFNVPASGPRNRISNYAPENMCAEAGDHLAFNDEGGFDPANGYPDGVPFQVFARAPGSVTRQYTADNGTKNGAVFSGFPVSRQELLLEATIATGPDATPLCPGGTLGTTGRRQPPQPGGPRIRLAAQAPRVRAGRVPVFVSCGRNRCSGGLRLRAARGGRRIGGARFSIEAFRASAVRVRLSRSARRLAARRGGLRVAARVATRNGSAARRLTLRTR